MNILSKKELNEIQGGAIHWGVIGAIAGAVTFIIGVIDGIVNPLKCRK